MGVIYVYIKGRLLFLILIFLLVVFFLKSSFCETNQLSIEPPKVKPAPKQSEIKPSQPPSQFQQAPSLPSQVNTSSPYFLSVSSFTASSSVINYGDDLTLSWVITGKNLKNLKLEIEPHIGQIPLTRTDYSNEFFRIEGSKTIKPLQDTKYVLKVSASDPFKIDVDPRTGRVSQRSLIASKELFITVKKPKIENVKPSVNQKTMEIKFFAKNTGNGDFISSPIKVIYHIISSPNRPYPPLALGEFTTANLNIKQGDQVELGKIILEDKERALGWGDRIFLAVKIEPIYKLPLEKDDDIYEHKWEKKELIINNEFLKIFSDLLSGSIKINNYYSGGCFAGTTTTPTSPFTTKKQKLTSEEQKRIFFEALPCLPGDPYYKQNDCSIKFPKLNSRQNFSVPRYELTKGWVFTYDYRGYVYDLNASWSGKDTFSISEGKIKFRISFETEGTEIKGYEYTQGHYYDYSAPDYDLIKFDMEIHLTPGLRLGKISYIDVQIFPEVKGQFVSGYQYIPNSSYWENEIDKKLTKEISNRLRDTMLSDSIRGKIEEAIEKAITKNPLFDIFRITNVRSEGENIIIEYIYY